MSIAFYIQTNNTCDTKERIVVCDAIDVVQNEIIKPSTMT
jgi:hypothetical protein